MTEQELRGLAPFVELPPERDLAPAVRARLGTRRPRPRRPVLVLALLVVAVAAAFAVRPARSAIVHWLGFGTARIEFVDRLPDVRTRRPLDLGPRTSLADARDRVTYHVATSSLLGAPDEVHLLGDQVGFVYGRHKLVVLQSRGTYFYKGAGPTTRVVRVLLDGRVALWISGGPHVFGYIRSNRQTRPAPLYLVGNALIWKRDDGVTLRLEGKLTRAQALRIARSFG